MVYYSHDAHCLKVFGSISQSTQTLNRFCYWFYEQTDKESVLKLDSSKYKSRIGLKSQRSNDSNTEFGLQRLHQNPTLSW